jgi:hypothetical protein
MKEHDFVFQFGEQEEKLLPLLIGRVFHVTNLNNLKPIVDSGEIRPNINGDLSTTFGFSSNSFFRKRGCISVFDYRFATAEQIEESLRKCSPYPGASDGKEFAYLFLSECLHNRLIPWIKWKEEEAWGQMIVPYVEAGYPGPVSIGLIDEVFRVIIHPSQNPLVVALRQARRQKY